MLDQLHDGDLPLHLLQDRLGQLVLVNDLYGHLFAQDAVGGQLDETWKKEEKFLSLPLSKALLSKPAGQKPAALFPALSFPSHLVFLIFLQFGK